MATHISVSGHTNRSYGGGPGDYVAAILGMDPHEFGPALRNIEITLISPGRVTLTREMLLRMSPSFSNWREPNTFPPLEADLKIRFERKNRKLVVNWPSSKLTPNEQFLTAMKTLTRDQYFRAFDEVIDALSLALSKRLKPTDDFDGQGMLLWLREKRDVRYESDEALRTAAGKALEISANYYEQLDPWEKLYVNWAHMHPDARKILDRPEDWSQSDEFSPHGNDTGANIFAQWRHFARCSVAQAGHRLELPPLSDDLPDFLWSDWVHVHIALAFGHLKKSGTCPPTLARETRDIIDKERGRVMKNHDWPHRDAWLARLDRCDQILCRY